MLKIRLGCVGLANDGEVVGRYEEGQRSPRVKNRRGG